MTPAFEAYLADARSRADRALFNTLPAAATPPAADALAGLETACRYPLEVGGKRIRPILCYAAAATVGQWDAPGLDEAAAALELIHTYSLIHDDLPAMDDDDLRRGKPTLHKAYDEATAVLVGDALQARAFELLAAAPGLDDRNKVAMLRLLAQAAGPAGMVGGQFIDIQVTDTTIALPDLSAMHALKTGALIKASVALGAIAAGGSTAQLAALERYATHIGLAFQVVDDILDVEGDTATLGKTRGKDCEANKPTYVKLLGLAGAKAEASRLLEEALDSLAEFGEDAGQLRSLAQYIITRDR